MFILSIRLWLLAHSKNGEINSKKEQNYICTKNLFNLAELLVKWREEKKRKKKYFSFFHQNPCRRIKATKKH